VAVVIVSTIPITSALVVVTTIRESFESAIAVPVVVVRLA
jgi:hypothetical protein